MQPNIGEFMDTFDPLELLNANNRLPSVPEEGPDEFLRFFGGELNALDGTLSWGNNSDHHHNSNQETNRAPHRTEVVKATTASATVTRGTASGGSSSVAMYLTGPPSVGGVGVGLGLTAANEMSMPQRRGNEVVVGGSQHHSPGGSTNVDAQQMDLGLMDTTTSSYVKEQHAQQQQVQYTAQMYTQTMQQQPHHVSSGTGGFVAGGAISSGSSSGLFGNTNTNTNNNSNSSNNPGIKGPASNLLKALDQQQQQNQQQGVSNRSTGQHPFKFIRRDPHNYDKQSPTAHQTLMYNQIINEQTGHQTTGAQGDPGNSSSNNITTNPHQQQQLHLRSNSLEHNYQQQPNQDVLPKTVISSGNNYLFKTIDDVNMIGLPPGGDPKMEFGRSNSLPVNASMQMMAGGSAVGMSLNTGGNMFEGTGVESVSAQIRTNESQFLSPRNKMQQQKYQMAGGVGIGLGGMQSSVSSQQLSQIGRQGQGHGSSASHVMQTANSEPALVQLLQKHNNSPGLQLSKDQLHGQRPYPPVKLEKSLSFHVADTNNNCDGDQQQQQLSTTGLAFVQHLVAASSGTPPGTKGTSSITQGTATMLHSPPGGSVGRERAPSVGDKHKTSPLVSPVTSVASPDGGSSSMMEVAMKLNMGSSKKEPTDIQDMPSLENKRSGHIYSEQKRRIHIKNGFDLLHSLIPQLQQSASSSSASKMSKAAVLQKGAEYIKQLKVERVATNEKMERLRKERDALNNQISLLHSALPANGAPVSRQRTGKIMDMYNQYVLSRTYEHWKFWIVSI